MRSKGFFTLFLKMDRIEVFVRRGGKTVKSRDKVELGFITFLAVIFFLAVIDYKISRGRIENERGSGKMKAVIPPLPLE